MKKNFVKAALAAFILVLSYQFSTGQTFHHNIDDAKNLARKAERPMALVFSGSDWCKPCIQLRTTILEDPSFIDFAEEHLVLVEVDFPYKKANRLSKEQQQHNEKLAEQYNQQGVFPLVVLTDATGNRMGDFSYDKRLKVDDYIRHVEQLIAD